jgi:predicted metal-dependent hydrolase
VASDFPWPFGLRYSSRAKQLRLVVKPTGVELVVPPAVGETRALEFLHQHRTWVERKLAELRSRPQEQPEPQRLETGTTVPFQGREVPLVVREAQGRRARVEFDGRFLIALPCCAPAEAEHYTRAALFAWIKVWLRDEAALIGAKHASRYGLHPQDIRIKRMKSRWGSCGPRNDINLNWLLAFVPPSVLEYVMVHELCHIRHRDHSALFWDLVGRHLPHYPRERQWLRRNGAELLRRFG